MGPEPVFIILILTVGAVSLLRPITKRLGLLLESMARENDRRGQRPLRGESEGLRDLLESMSARLDRIEERQEFTDALLRGSDTPTRAARPALRPATLSRPAPASAPSEAGLADPADSAPGEGSASPRA
jgi:hypothetical protein